MGGYGLGGYGLGGYGTGSGGTSPVTNLAFEQGFVALVNTAPANGGYFMQLPENFSQFPTWTYTIVSDPSDYTLQGAVELSAMRMQIDCYGANGAQAITLAKAIDRVLSGFLGTLSDGTIVQGIFRTNKIDFFDDAARNYRRMLEYQIWYVEP